MAERRSISDLGPVSIAETGIDPKSYEPVAIMPEMRVVKLGGQSLLDRGRVAVFPVLDELIAAREKGLPILVCCGGGTRARHIYSIASELELPTGMLATLGSFVPVQNARMIQMLTAKHGGVYIGADDFEKLPLYVRMGCLPIMTGMPPFGYWEKRDNNSRIPPNRTDAGVFLSAEFLGCKRAIFIKDEDGLFTDDPKKNPNATHIPRISAKELIERNLNDLVLERVVIEYLSRSKWVKELQIVNGLIPGNVTAALEGQDVGTIIFHEE
jgi:molybdenum storage protein